MRSWTIEQLKEAVKNSINIPEVLRKLNLRVAGGNYANIKKHILLNNIEISHFNNSIIKNLTSFKEILKNEEIFCENSKVSRNAVKKRLLKENLIEHKCKECGLQNSWNNKPITLQLEHINGIFNDNRLENLCWLCPNCHTQTETFCGKNKKIKVKPKKICKQCSLEIHINSNLCSYCTAQNKAKISSEDILKQYEVFKNYVYVGKLFNMSDVNVKKRISSYKKHLEKMSL